MAFPSPVVMLSVIAIALAGVAYVVTGDDEPTERKVEIVAQPKETQAPEPSAEPKPTKKPKPKPRPQVNKGQIYVEVYNNSNVSGLAGRTADQISDAGWQVVGTDNWVGTIPEPTVYHPPRLERAAKQLALDLGINRVKVAVEPMKFDRLTVILTG